MPVVTKYICDGCGVEKGETNHWFHSRVDSYGFTVSGWDRAGQGIHCGEKCVLAALSKWMQERKDQDMGGVK